MPIHNHNRSNKEPRITHRGWYVGYNDRICTDCGHVITSPVGKEWPCAWCETHPIMTEGQADILRWQDEVEVTRKSDTPM